MKCPYCDSENREQAKFCSECGKELSVANVSESPVQANENESDSGSQTQKTSSPFRLLWKIVTVAASIFFIICLISFLWGFTMVPRNLWQENVCDETRQEIEAELVNAGFPVGITVQSTSSASDNYRDLDFDRKFVPPWNYSKEFDISNLLFVVFDKWKGLFVYDIRETWNISIDNTDLGTVKTVTTIVAQLKWNGQPLYIDSVDIELPPDLYAQAEEYQKRAKQEELERIIQLKNFYHDRVEDWLIGQYDQLIVEYQWTNIEGYATSPLWDVTIDVYQDGVQLERDYSYDEPYDALTNIAAGDTITNSIAFRLDNTYSDIEVVVKRYLSDVTNDSSSITHIVSMGQYREEQETRQGSGSEADFIGEWVDITGAGCRLDITAQSTEGYCTIDISWWPGMLGMVQWSYVGKYDETTGGILCSQGTRTESFAGKYVGEMYSGSGTAWLWLHNDGYLEWENTSEDLSEQFPDMTFLFQRSNT